MSLNLNTISFRPATAADWPAIAELLQTNKLPLEGAQAHLHNYLLAWSGSQLLGCAGAEQYGDIALLRSFAVAPNAQQQGLGKAMLSVLLDQAGRRQISQLFLLTVTAPEYFAQFGFKRGRIEEAPAALKASAELQGACPACAAFMSLRLTEPAAASALPSTLPVAVIGAGPVGLAAVAKLIARGIPFIALEAGPQAGQHLLDYGHVRLFSPWRYNVDADMAALLAPTGWQAPPQEGMPLAREIVEQVLQPFAALPAVARGLQLNTRVLAISREGMDKVKSAGRAEAPFVIRAEQQGRSLEFRARAVIDATGTWGQPNPLGANGLPAAGEAAAAAHIAYGIPDVLGTQRQRYAGKRTLVVGAGHSAANALLALAELALEAPGTELVWAVRSATLTRVFGGGDSDALPARGALGTALRQLRDSGRMRFVAGLRIDALHPDGAQLSVRGHDANGAALQLDGIDEIICATGQRPDLRLASELRLDLDSALESTTALGPLIDPNLHSCGTVRPHGHRELSHAEPGFYTVGVKSYGRAPTFLMATGFEQVRSVVAALDGDLEAADRVELDLPATGVCSVELGSAGPATASTSAASCCAKPTPAAATGTGTARPAASCCG
ncbi:arsenic resistance N-acetyltransferase ArsN2 [Paucibacter sp. APW11]|uniref:Arsenic resistance N-acetyltransferase ArsN2 n=1 Tax=Roseateles aquae TaxID=3077235 RepID=A0ABU3P8H3_9BURK|nr:arsenic resistance N-acetyltransferase ArsN2 [Paucibacter sp. APW11]MDT8998877.1 arsenic resistance N-acetyltransferase ArsN2 [Paucibacter sp. APW11]